MERKKFKQLLLDFGYSGESIKKILQGKMVPTLAKAIRLNDEFGVPYDAWKDIKLYLSSPHEKSIA